MTGDFRLMRLKPTKQQGTKYKDGTPLIEFLIEKAKKGVSVRIISAEDSINFQNYVEDAYCKAPQKFVVCFCARCHAKVVIVDDEIAYIGSANMTKAGLGQPHCSPGNFEVGVLTDNSDAIASLNTYFSRIESHEFCEGCHRTKDCIEDKW